MCIRDRNIGGLYLPGGYPELYAKTLSENKTMLASIRQAVQAGLPTAAECGGFLYLGRSLEDADGKAWPMADVLPGDGIRVGRLVRFGYAEMTAKADSMLFCAGETLPIHEFHHWDSTAFPLHFCKREFLCGVPAFILGGHAQMCIRDRCRPPQRSSTRRIRPAPYPTAGSWPPRRCPRPDAAPP